LVPVRKQPGLPALLVPVATTGTNGLYKPELKAFFSTSERVRVSVCVDARGEIECHLVLVRRGKGVHEC
jgi:hypothetical protein